MKTALHHFLTVATSIGFGWQSLQRSADPDPAIPLITLAPVTVCIMLIAGLVRIRRAQ
jgi:hypothetical protein